jgi:hypothetical protein
MGIRLVMGVGDWALPQSGGVFLHYGYSDLHNRRLKYNTKNYMRGLKNIEGGMFQNRGGGVSFTVKRQGGGGYEFQRALKTSL